ncbi:MAG: histidine phosphatase family protein [Bacteroidota bacterium]
MRLYLMRHGPAVALHRDGDPARPLSDAGAALVARVAPVFARTVADAPPTALLTSNYTRAKQTGALVGDALGLTPEVTTLIHPHCGISDLEMVWDIYNQPDSWMVVGHQPAFGELVRLLTHSHVAMRPGTIAVIDAPAVRLKTGYLVGLYPPDALAALAPANGR